MLTAQIFPFGTEYKDRQNMPNGTQADIACHTTVELSPLVTRHHPRSGRSGARRGSAGAVPIACAQRRYAYFIGNFRPDWTSTATFVCPW
jgi:hypothetical protein